MSNIMLAKISIRNIDETLHSIAWYWVCYQVAKNWVLPTSCRCLGQALLGECSMYYLELAKARIIQELDYFLLRMTRSLICMPVTYLGLYPFQQKWHKL